MPLLIEDSARNVMPSWAINAVGLGIAQGAVLSPFTTPRVGTGYKRGVHDIIQRLRDGGAEVWLNPETHSLQMPAVGDFRYYDDWPLWAGPRGDLSSEGVMRGHVEHVFEEQDRLGVPHLAPTILLHSPQSATSQNALDLARIAVETDPTCRLTIAGDPAFWAAGSVLDSHIGALAQLEPSGWWLTVVRNLTSLPVPAIPEEVHGLCRTSRALSEDGPVHISHGDLAGLPAIAAGATTLGVGWDTRQRVCSYGSYEQRDASGESGGQWLTQVTFEGLLSHWTQGDAQVLAQQDPQLSMRLTPGTVGPGPEEAFSHHATVLTRVANPLQQLPPRDAYQALIDRYDAATSDWQSAAAAVGTTSRHGAWITPLSDGLRLYGRTEGY
jgi:hypothetical protein